MAYGVDGTIDGALVDSPVLSHSPRTGGFLAPLLVLSLGEQLVEQEAIFLGKLADPIEDLVDGCATHEFPRQNSTSRRWRSAGLPSSGARGRACREPARSVVLVEVFAAQRIERWARCRRQPAERAVEPVAEIGRRSRAAWPPLRRLGNHDDLRLARWKVRRQRYLDLVILCDPGSSPMCLHDVGSIPSRPFTARIVSRPARPRSRSAGRGRSRRAGASGLRCGGPGPDCGSRGCGSRWCRSGGLSLGRPRRGRACARATRRARGAGRFGGRKGADRGASIASCDSWKPGMRRVYLSRRSPLRFGPASGSG